MLARWQGGAAAAIVALIVVILVASEAADEGVRRYWSTHTFTADTVAGLLVVAITVLVVDQVIRRRELGQRSRAVAAQASIVMAQAGRAVRAVTAARDAEGDRSAAAEEVRSYLLVLVVSAPVLIEAPVPRRFLEQAQRLAAEMGRIIAPSDVAHLTGAASGSLEDAITQMRSAAAPLLAVLSADQRSVAAAGEA